MPVATREATIVCEGALASGNGTRSSGSGSLEQLPITWASRTERPDGKTYDRRGSGRAVEGAMAAADTMAAGGHARSLGPVRAVRFEAALAGVAAGCGGGVDRVVGVARADQADARRERGAALVVSDLSELLEAP